METAELLKIQELFKDLHAKIDQLSQKKDAHVEPHRSWETKQIAEALAKAQEEMRIANLNKTNSYLHTGYADLVSVVQASRSSLSKNGLSVTQQIINNEDGSSLLLTTLWHVSGEWIGSRTRITPPKNDIKSIMSYTGALKRMCYASLVGVVDMGEDDDGEIATATERSTFAQGAALNLKYEPKKESAEVVSKEQLDELEYELKGYKDICEDILSRLNLMCLADMPKSKYHYAIRKIREIKNIREGRSTPSAIQEVT